jgi:WD40 repeat protein
LTERMLPPLSAHPSPLNIIAISSDGRILLSASLAPLTVYLNDQRLSGNGFVQFCPREANANITCAAFQTPSDIRESSNAHFLLGFQDGMVAVYRVSISPIPHDSVTSHNQETLSIHLRPVLVGATKSLHKAAMGGCTAAAFVPGYRSRIVSTGRDGRCRLVDFGDGGTILRT